MKNTRMFMGLWKCGTIAQYSLGNSAIQRESSMRWKRRSLQTIKNCQLQCFDPRSQDRGDIQLSESASHGIPIIERKDLHYDPKIDEIRRGTFGAIYKAS